MMEDDLACNSKPIGSERAEESPSPAVASPGHTKGPWEVRYRFGRLTTVSGRQRFPICDTGTAPRGEANGRREEANARLIAAAPEMYEALAMVEPLLDYFANGRQSFVGPGSPKSALALVQVAISKATGHPLGELVSGGGS